MAKSEQILKKIEIHQLKGHKELEIDFTEKPLTAILGPNGVGKSTILHIIACINNPVIIPYQTTNHRLSEFFTPTSHSIWTGSSYFVFQDYRDGANQIKNHKTHFRKQRSRWAPRYVSRVERYTSFIGIKTCVPIIENETQQSRIRFNTTPLNDNISNKVKDLAGYVMNRNYTSYNNHVSGSKKYIGVSFNEVQYSSLSMGAGEQRIFYILSEVSKSPNYGLIIIDEIDLLLHQDALFRLTEVLHKIATEKHLQIIFTTHAQSLLQLEYIAFRHLYQTPEKTLCFQHTKPDTLHRLTGVQVRPLEIFVEDDLAIALIKKICSEEGLSKYVSINKYGAAINCFTAVCGSILNDLNNQENMLFVLDGDEYESEEEKIERLKKVMTGDTNDKILQRTAALSRISQFNLPQNNKPEYYYHKLICELNQNNLTQEEQEIIKVAKEIVNPGDAHRFFSDIIIRMDYNFEVGLHKLVDLLSKSEEWNNIKAEIKSWLDSKRDQILEI